MSAVRFLDSQDPPRKRMRKGTKSCTECRRRKIRCTFDSDRPNVCNECHARGLACIDQEYGNQDSKAAGVLPSEQSYSLRERVTQLENVVRDILHRMEQNGSSTSSSPVQNQPQHYEDATAHSSKQLVIPTRSHSTTETICEETKVDTSNSFDAPITENNRIENAPVLQIFNNNVVSRTEGAASRNQDAAAIKDISPKAIAARNELIKLIPPRGDLIQIRKCVSHWWVAWVHITGHGQDETKQSPLNVDDILDIPESPGEVAKFLLCHLMCIEQLPAGFNTASLEMPFETQEYTDRCIATIDRLIINDEDLSSTLPGLEVMALSVKYFWNIGRPRKAWLMNRKATELAQLAGLHISTAKDPHPNDKLYYRRLKLWTMIGLNERFLCLILGLPTAISDKHFTPQVKRHLKMQNNNMEAHSLRLSLVMGAIIDRNQDDPADMSIAETLRLEQELETQARAMPDYIWKSNPFDEGLSFFEKMERLLLPFFYHFLRATLHLPFMLKSQGDRRFRFSHEAALESARDSLVAYNKLRTWEMMNPFICRVIDFHAFSMTMLLVINIMGYSEDAPNHSPEQDDRDWSLVDNTIAVLRHAASEPAGTVAAQSLIILEGLSKSADDIDPNVSCKVTVPYFGVITLTPGKKIFKSRRNTQQPTPASTASSCSFTQVSGDNLTPTSTMNSNNNNPKRGSGLPSPYQLYTPPQSIPSEATGAISSSASSYANYQPPLQDDSRIQLENILGLPNAGIIDPSAFTELSANDDNLGMWSNMNLDLDLDQGWNLDWTNGTLM